LPDIIPIKDSDNDGLSDELDKCPKQTETFNGFEDTDGCPDVIPDKEPSNSKYDNSLLQWTAVIASCITAAGGIAAAKYRKH